MAKVARKVDYIRSVPKTLAEKIDEAGRAQEGLRNASRMYNIARKEVLNSIPSMAEGVFSLKEEGDRYYAELIHTEEKVVDPLAVMDLNAELFWRLVRINVTDIESLLSEEDFCKVTQVKRKDIPVLFIRKKEKEE